MLAAMPSPSDPPVSGAFAAATAGRGRDDACPGALRLHAADDGALARIRVPGGLLTLRQAEAAATAADRLGDGRIDLTSRGNLQVRGLRDPGAGTELAALLGEADCCPRGPTNGPATSSPPRSPDSTAGATATCAA